MKSLDFWKMPLIGSFWQNQWKKKFPISGTWRYWKWRDCCCLRIAVLEPKILSVIKNRSCPKIAFLQSGDFYKIRAERILLSFFYSQIMIRMCIRLFFFIYCFFNMDFINLDLTWRTNGQMLLKQERKNNNKLIERKFQYTENGRTHLSHPSHLYHPFHPPDIFNISPYSLSCTIFG
jgi:hypothetical protein